MSPKDRSELAALPVTDEHTGGMSIREEIAARALQGLLANPAWFKHLTELGLWGTARGALKAAEIADMHAMQLLCVTGVG